MAKNTSESLVPVDVAFDPFGGGALAAVAPATAPQREVVLASRFGDDVSLAFNEVVNLRLVGPLDRPALEAALRALTVRHESLRTTFSPDVELLIAEPDPAGDVLDAPVLDSRNRAPAEAEADAVERPFALETGPLFRAELARSGPEDHTLVLAAHHAVLDGWSTGVILKELAALYSAAAAPGGDVSKADLPAPGSWTDYAAREHARDDQADVAWWLEQLRSPALPGPLDLPADRPRPAVRTYASARVDVHLENALVTRFEDAARAEGASFFAWLFAGFTALLARVTTPEGDGADLVVGIPAAGQASEGRAGRHLVGHAVQLLPVRVAVLPDSPFSAHVAAVKDRLYAAFDHTGVTYGRLLEELALPRDPSRPPLVAVQFNLDQALEPSALPFRGLEVTLRTVPRVSENFELFVNAQRAASGLHLECQFNTGLFDATTIAARMAEFGSLLTAAAETPSLPVKALRLLASAERERLERLGEGPALTAAALRTVPESIADAPAAATALTDETGTWTYGDLNVWANARARELVALGVVPGDVVGLAMARSRELVGTALAILRAGAAYVPVDPDYPESRVQYMVEHSQARLVVADAATAARLPPLASPVRVLTGDSRSDAALPAGDGARLMYVIYTSGSTGKPKGVEVPHSAVAAFLDSTRGLLGLGPASRVVAVTTLSFDIAVLELWGPLTAGGTAIIASRETAQDARALGELLARSRATAMQATPSTWRLLVESGWTPSRPFAAWVGGEAFPRDLEAPLLARADAVWNLYGPTETTVWSTAYRLSADEATRATALPIGLPLAGEAVRVVDATGAPCPIGVPGELWIGGAGVTRGYRFDPAQTAARFVNDDRGARWYRTGDLVRWQRHASGARLVFERRLDSQVKVRGFRIELGEIEAALAGHPTVLAAAARVVEPRPGDTRLAGYVVPREAGRADLTELRRVLGQKLPPYMVPQHLFALDALPLTPNGKVDRKALPFVLEGGESARPVILPVTPTEKALISVVAEVLGLRRVSMDADFFDLGGHSILATRVVAGLRQSLGLELPLRRIFETPTLRALADHLEALAGVAALSTATDGDADLEELTL
ncbi:MAG: amino acid adenylation domain-containing protein [Myxococcales bacterium]|nr:amino acid adenylation domain-containing protein [Myxococcales bacterium]